MKSLHPHLPLETQFNIKKSHQQFQDNTTEQGQNRRISSKLQRIRQILQILEKQRINPSANLLTNSTPKPLKQSLSSSKLPRPFITPLNLGSLQGSKFNSLTKDGQQHFIKRAPNPSNANKYTISMTEEESETQYNHKKYLFEQSDADFDLGNALESSGVNLKQKSIK